MGRLGHQRDSRMVGRAGEYAVAAQLLLRDTLVCWPSVDLGYDLLADNGCRVQVRCGHLSNSDGRAGQHYAFMLRKQKPVPVSNTAAKLVEQRPFVEVCDYVVFWGIEQNRFWIVPAEVADSCSGVRLAMDLITRPRLVAKINDVRELVSLGYSQEQIAKQYNTASSVIQRFLQNGRDWEETAASKMRGCENNWEVITEFVRTEFVTSSESLAKENIGESI